MLYLPLTNHHLSSIIENEGMVILIMRLLVVACSFNERSLFINALSPDGVVRLPLSRVVPELLSVPIYPKEFPMKRFVSTLKYARYAMGSMSAVLFAVCSSHS